MTNIELDKGIMPAPIIRNTDWSGKWSGSVLLAASFARLRVSIISEGPFVRIQSLFLAPTG
ncbi:hypothetical protein C1890_25365 [Pseudomonas sp. DP16D-R1]|nr:hypothetical protein C1890_25365 [Pseudomonas sp. DP16D-R1]